VNVGIVIAQEPYFQVLTSRRLLLAKQQTGIATSVVQLSGTPAEKTAWAESGSSSDVTR
jgi:hypothetical protein